MKKCFGLAATLALALALTLPAGAAGQLDYITDDVGLLSESEWTALESRAREIADQYACGVYAIIVDDYADFGFSMEAACDNIYQSYQLGYGADGDALVLLLSMEERDYWLLDYGPFGEYALTDYGHETLVDAMLEDLGEDDWYGGLSKYLEQGAVVLEAAQSGQPLDLPELTLAERLIFAYGAALVVGIIAAFITCTIFKAQMKSAQRATSAEEYVAPQGVDMHIREDRYTHTTRRRRKIQKPTPSRSGGSGGGRTSRGGKF